MNFENGDFGAHEAEEPVPSQESDADEAKKKQWMYLVCLRNAKFELLHELQKENIPALLEEGFLNSEKLREAAQEGILVCAKKDDIGGIIHIRDCFDPGDDFYSSEEVRGTLEEAIAEGIKKISSDGFGGSFAYDPYWDHYIDINSLIGRLHLESSPRIKKSIQEWFTSCAAAGSTAEAIRIKEIFMDSDETFLSSAEAKNAVIDGIIHWAKEGNLLAVEESEKMYSELDENFVRVFDSEQVKRKLNEAAKEGIVPCIEKGDMDEVIRFSNTFHISNDSFRTKKTKEAAGKAILKILESEHPSHDDIYLFQDEFGVDTKTVQFQQAAGEAVKRLLQKGDRDGAEDISRLFNLN